MKMEVSSEKTLTQWSVAELGSFFAENRHFFLSHARRLMGSASAAEELVQDALLRVLLAAPELPSKLHAVTYFHRTLENLAKDIFRAQGRRPNLVAVDDVIQEIDEAFTADTDHSEVIQRADDLALIRDALSLLSPAQRTALVMWEFEGRSSKEIAETIGSQEQSVRFTISRARASLRRILEERIVDEARGLTALDLMSTTFRKASTQVKKSSRLVMSLLLVAGAFLGLNSMVNTLNVFPAGTQTEDSQTSNFVPKSKKQSEVASGKSQPDIDSSKKDAFEDGPSVISSTQSFAGLNSDGVPEAFTVANDSGLLGELFLGPVSSIRTETGWMINNVVSNRSSGPNVILDQSIILDAFGTNYLANLSIGLNGVWTPLEASVASIDSERLPSGSYLISALIVVEGTLDPVIQMPTGISGTDLDRTPSQFVVKLLLDPSKTEILAQAVLISGSSQPDEA